MRASSGRFALIAAVALAATAVLAKSARRKARVDDRWQWLEYGWLMKGLSLVVVTGVVVLVGVLVTVGPADRIYVAGLILVFGGLGIPLAIESFTVRIAFDDDHIHCFSGWRKDRVVPWSAVGSCSYSEACEWWVLQTEGHGAIRIHRFLSGKESFFESLQEKTGIDADDGS